MITAYSYNYREVDIFIMILGNFLVNLNLENSFENYVKRYQVYYVGKYRKFNIISAHATVPACCLGCITFSIQYYYRCTQPYLVSIAALPWTIELMDSIRMQQ